jgi:hypothetical protein
LTTHLRTGTKTRSAIGTLVDRKCGYVLLLHLRNTHTAIDVNAALTATMSTDPATSQAPDSEIALLEKVAVGGVDSRFAIAIWHWFTASALSCAYLDGLGRLKPTIASTVSTTATTTT